MTISFKHDFDFEYGVVSRLAPNVRRVIADNPGPFTFTGTGTYILGCGGGVAVIDPGPLLSDHIDAICAALEPDEHVSHILITHTHSDHSPGAAPLRARTGAETYGFYAPSSGEKDRSEDFRAAGDDQIALEEAADDTFVPDHRVFHGDIISGDSWSVECVHTPGHMANHVCYGLCDSKILFSGDHVMGWSTSVIAPPDGNMGDYISSLRHLLTRDDVIYWPTHGPAITDPHDFVRSFIAHREAREGQILDALTRGVHQISDIVADLYQDVDERLHPAACLSVFAHLQNLSERGRVRALKGEPSLSSDYFLM